MCMHVTHLLIAADVTDRHVAAHAGLLLGAQAAAEVAVHVILLPPGDRLCKTPMFQGFRGRVWSARVR